MAICNVKYQLLNHIAGDALKIILGHKAHPLVWEL